MDMCPTHPLTARTCLCMGDLPGLCTPSILPSLQGRLCMGDLPGLCTPSILSLNHATF